MTFHRIALCFFSLASCVTSHQTDDLIVSDSALLVNTSRGRKLNNPTPLVLGCYGPITSLSTTFLATAVLFDIDLRKQTEASGAGAALKTKFGDPVVPIPSLNPNLRVTLIIGTSNSDPEKGLRTALDFFLGMNGIPKVAGVVGGFHSGISMPVATVAASLNIPQVSWGSTHPKLSNRVEYPYFLRTIPVDSLQGRAMWTFIKYFGLPQVSMLYAKEIYGELLYTTVANLAGSAQETFRISGVGIKYMPGQTYDQAEAGKAIQQAIDSGNKFWLIAMDPDQATMLLATMELTKYKVYNSVSYQLLGCEHVGRGQATPRPSVAIKQGFTRFHRARKGPLFPKFEAMWLKLKQDDVTGTAATARYLLDKMQVKLGDGRAEVPTDAMFADMSNLHRDALFIFDACYTFAFAFNTLLNAGKAVADIKGKTLFEEVWNTKFTGISGPVAFDKDGDRLALCDIDNYQTPAAGGEPTPVTVARYDAATAKITMEASKTMYWMDDKTGCATGGAPTAATCSDSAPADFFACNPGFYKESGTMVCRPCAEGYHTTTRGTPSTCNRCKPGTYANNKTGATDCLECPLGEYSTPASISSTCLPCPSGQVGNKDKGATECCFPGRAPASATFKCEACPAGKFSPDGKKCLDCASGKISLGGAEECSITTTARPSTTTTRPSTSTTTTARPTTTTTARPTTTTRPSTTTTTGPLFKSKQRVTGTTGSVTNEKVTNGSDKPSGYHLAILASLMLSLVFL